MSIRTKKIVERAMQILAVILITALTATIFALTPGAMPRVITVVLGVFALTMVVVASWAWKNYQAFKEKLEEACVGSASGGIHTPWKRSEEAYLKEISNLQDELKKRPLPDEPITSVVNFHWRSSSYLQVIDQFLAPVVAKFLVEKDKKPDVTARINRELINKGIVQILMLVMFEGRWHTDNPNDLATATRVANEIIGRHMVNLTTSTEKPE